MRRRGIRRTTPTGRRGCWSWRSPDAVRHRADGRGSRRAPRRARAVVAAEAADRGGQHVPLPYDVAGVRAIADEVGAYVMYGAAHMGRLIAGGRFQQPLRRGAHLMTGSTYKSLGGPAGRPHRRRRTGGAARRDRLSQTTANFDLARTAALALAMLDTLSSSVRPYADACIENAAALAEALAAREVAVFSVPGRGSSASSSSSRSSGSWFTSRPARGGVCRSARRRRQRTRPAAGARQRAHLVDRVAAAPTARRGRTHSGSAPRS
ncbi:MAG: hypothetical protein R2705_13770 [Ilumatobacteraceae bacterium]